jgi:hypothetical protein
METNWEFFENKQADASTRKMAGLALFDRTPEKFWETVERMMKSGDACDRITAFNSLCEVDDKRKFRVILDFLSDEDLAFEAIDFLLCNRYFLARILRRLTELVQSENPKTRAIAFQKINDFGMAVR